MNPINRPISTEEIRVISIALERTFKSAKYLELLPQIPTLQVVAKCDCGCESIEFLEPIDSGKSEPIADGLGTTPSGGEIGIIVWGTGKNISGLEIYDLGAGQEKLSLPAVDSIRPFEADA